MSDFQMCFECGTKKHDVYAVVYDTLREKQYMLCGKDFKEKVLNQ